MNLNSKRYIGAGLILAAMLPLSNGSRLLSAQGIFMQESTQRDAMVVALEHGTPDRTGHTNRAMISVVEFVDDNGTRRTARTNVSSYPAPNTVGEEIDVRVHNRRSDDVRVVSFTGLWFESAFYLVPGFVTLITGIVLVRKKNNITTSA